MSSLALILITVCWGIYIFSRRHLYKLAWEIGGPIGLPLLGSIFEFRTVEDFMENMQNKIWSKYKSPCAVWAGTGLHILIRDPATARAVLTSDNFLDKHMMYEPFRIILGENSIISSKVKVWKHHRKAADPALSYKNVNQLIPAFNNAISTFMTDFLSQNVGKGEVDIKDSLVRLFGDLTVENTMGQSLHLFQSSRNEETLLDHLTKLQHICVQRSIKLYLHIDFIFKFTKAHQKLQKTNAKVHRIIGRLLRKHPDPKTRLKYTNRHNSILDYLKKHKGQKTFSEKDIICDIGSIMVASYETTAFAVFIMIFYMAQYPNLQNKVFEELFSVYPQKNPQVGMDTLNDLVYTEMFINEALRLHPPVPLIGRQASQNIRLSTGQFMPRGTQVLVDMVHLHRNEEVWGPKANEFNPDNFLPQNMEQLPLNAFMPFSLGPRNCLGIRYAKIIIKIAIAKLVRTYEFKTSWTTKDLILIPGIVTVIENNPLISIDERLK